MAIDFPSSPSVGATWPNPPVAGQPVYTWDGEKWTSGTGYGNIYISDSAPAAPIGSLWWNSATGVLYVRYNDGNSTQWVAVAGGPTDAVLYSTAQALTTLQQAQARANIGALKKNYVINGAMMVSQENGSTVLSLTTTNLYPVDEFPMFKQMATGTANGAQVASVTPSGSPNRIRATVTAAQGSIAAGERSMIRQAIEGLRCADLKFGTASAKTITIQFGVKAPAGIYCVGVSNLAGTRCYVAEYTITAGQANTDVVKSVTIPGDVTGTWTPDNTGYLWIYWSLCAGSTYQTPAGVWTAGFFTASANQFNLYGTNGNVFELFDVGVYEGAAAPSFQVPDFLSELALCKRYWRKIGGAASLDIVLDGYSSAASLTVPTMISHPGMRAAPTWTVVGTFTAVNVSGTPVFNAGPDTTTVYVVSAAAAQTRYYSTAGGYFTANARN